jgi:hypothetical protein
MLLWSHAIPLSVNAFVYARSLAIGRLTVEVGENQYGYFCPTPRKFRMPIFAWNSPQRRLTEGSLERLSERPKRRNVKPDGATAHLEAPSALLKS